tara:strand:- start:42 stop:647 length:606 start_codon:yes stop_codon:yes gene_type:complete
LDPDTKHHGYVCVPYNHDKTTLDVKNMWNSSRNIKSIYFVTITFPNEIKPYFPTLTNHYMLAKFEDSQKIIKDANKFTNINPSFVFSIDEKLFERYTGEEQRFVSMYYIEYNDLDVITDIAKTLVSKEKIQQAGFAHMNSFCQNKPKFTFPYEDKIVILEVADNRSHQSICKYCEKISQDISRKGVTMHNFVSLSLLEKLK